MPLTPTSQPLMTSPTPAKFTFPESLSIKQHTDQEKRSKLYAYIFQAHVYFEIYWHWQRRKWCFAHLIWTQMVSCQQWSQKSCHLTVVFQYIALPPSHVTKVKSWELKKIMPQWNRVGQPARKMLWMCWVNKEFKNTSNVAFHGSSSPITFFIYLPWVA